ncbi:MAG: carboxypeptidase regulatory-like domain-containing protein, partial [Deltaproteobacteria bacterium]|nr:carboxypeptidase regulatory-like domain-containing protein [Deltaproteobacteria bacterium]
MKRVIAVVAVVLVVIIAWWLRAHHRDTKQTAHDQDSAQQSSGDSHARKGPQAPATLSGRVTRKPDGAPVANATVSIARAELGAEFLPSQAPTLVTQTDASGQWRQPIAPGTYILAATAPGLLPEALPKLVVGEGEQRGGLDFALEAGGTLVKGTVTDVGGGPIAGARITLKRSEDFSLTGQPDFATLTGQDGTYQLQVRDGDYSVHAAHDDYTKAQKSIEVKGKPITVDFTLVPGGSIKGRVIARESGKPVAGAWIDVRGKRSNSFGVGEAVSDDEGNFQLHSLASGAISLSAAGPGYASSSPTVVELGVGEQVDGITIKVDHAYTISGKVVDKRDKTKGVPAILIGGFSIASQQVALAHEPTDKDGRFEIVGVRPAAYTLAAFGEGKVPDIGKTVEVVDKDIKDVVIELETGVSISGRVEPPQAAQIALRLDGEIGLANMFQMAKVVMVRAKADPQTGAFKLEHVPAGKLVVTADTEDGAAGKTPVEIAEADLA